MKAACVTEQQERKQWTKQQQILHSYGNQEDELEPDSEEADPVDSDAACMHSLVGSTVQTVMTKETCLFWGPASMQQEMTNLLCSRRERGKSLNCESVAQYLIPVCLCMVAHKMESNL